MGWNIPELPSLHPIKRPSYLLWAIAFLLIMSVVFVLTFFLYQDKETILFWLLAIALPFILWLMMFSFRWVYHSYVKASNQEIQEQQQYITNEWQTWSKVQIPIFGQVLICAEPDGLAALTADSAKIPLYPKKARPLFNHSASLKPYWFLDDVMMSLTQQCADYRKYLVHIYLPDELIDDDELVEAIFKRWDLNPKPIYDYTAFMTNIHENPEGIELSLLLVCQYDDSAYHHHSKFISALLLGCADLIDKTGLQEKAWLGRLMVSDETSLSADIEQFFSYTQLLPSKVKDIWISGLNKPAQLALRMSSYALNVSGSSKVAFHDIDLTFSKPTSLTRYFVLTMASHSVSQSLSEQFTVSCDDEKIYVQLLSPEKLMS